MIETRVNGGLAGRMLRRAMLVPAALLVASVVTCCLSYSHAREGMADDLNEAMMALARENAEVWTRQDTIAALRHLHAATRGPLICQASDVEFRHPALKEEAYFMLALVDGHNAAPKPRGSRIASDSIMLLPERGSDGTAVRLQGFADCSMASVFDASDQRLPGVLFTLAMLSMTSMLVWRKEVREGGGEDAVAGPSAAHALDGLRLTPMQRRFARMLVEAPDMRVDKAALCVALWGNKSNAEESLYTLVRRTKAVLADAGFEVVCNRGESYELRRVKG